MKLATFLDFEKKIYFDVSYMTIIQQKTLRTIAYFWNSRTRGNSPTPTEENIIVIEQQVGFTQDDLVDNCSDSDDSISGVGRVGGGGGFKLFMIQSRH